jgi:hypothetical protein
MTSKKYLASLATLIGLLTRMGCAVQGLGRLTLLGFLVTFKLEVA